MVCVCEVEGECDGVCGGGGECDGVCVVEGRV